MTRQRQFLTGALVLGLSACAGGEDSGGSLTAEGDVDFCGPAMAAVEAYMGSQTRAAPGPEYGGTVVVAGVSEPRGGLNGFTSPDFATNQHLLFVTHMSLVRYDETLQAVPYLAESWELEDGALTFHLRRDVVWHDGTPTTARDVAFTYERAVDPETGFPNSSFFALYEGVDVLDDYTIRFRIRPHSEPLDTWRAVPIMPVHLLGDVAPGDLGSHPFGTRCPIGNGPFRFVSHEQDQQWVFEANQAFPAELGGRPHVDRYVYRVIPEETTLTTELLTGGIDVFISPSPDQGATIDASEAARVVAYDHREFIGVGWNSRRPQFADVRVRQALTMAIDRAGLVRDFLRGWGLVANSSVPPVHFAYDPSLSNAFAYDPDAAMALLDEAGWQDRDGDGVRENEAGDALAFSLSFNRSNQLLSNVGEALQADLTAIGADVSIDSGEWTSVTDRVLGPDRLFDAFIIPWSPEFRVDDTDLFHSRSTGPYAWTGTANDEIDRLIDLLNVVVDRSQATPLWHEYQRVVSQEQPNTFLFFKQRLDGVSTRLQGFTADARGDWANIHDWWIPEDQRKYGS